MFSGDGLPSTSSVTETQLTANLLTPGNLVAQANANDATASGLTEFIERYRHDNLHLPDPHPLSWSSSGTVEPASEVGVVESPLTASNSKAAQSKFVETAALSAAFTPSTTTTSVNTTDLSEFAFFDALLYESKPNLASEGMRPIQLLTSDFFWTSEELEAGQVYGDANLDLVRFNSAFLDTNQFAVIDIETWPTAGSDAVVADSIRKFTDVIDAMREAKPGIKLGIYSMVPSREYWAPVLSDNDSPDFQAWASTNTRLDALAAKVDVIFPSIYTFYPDYNEDGSPRLYEHDWWVEYAIENLLQAERYNKPTIAFIWPRYHGGGGTADPNSPDFRYWMNQPISEDFWNLILDTTAQYADGAVVFDYDGLATASETTPRPWVDNAAWWQATQGFIAAEGPATPAAELKVYGGTAVGSIADTRFSDGQYQQLSEVRYSGNTRTRVEHQWTFQVPGAATQFLVDGYHDSTVESFSFDYSLDGTTFRPMQISLTSTPRQYRFTFPANTTGTITVRLKDTNRLQNETVVDRVYLDRMAIFYQHAPDATLPTITIDDVTISEADAGTRTADFVVRRSGNLAETTTLSYTTQNGTATAAEDYLSRSPRTLFFPAGVAERTISVTVLDDATDEPDETWYVDLRGAVGARLLDSRGAGTLLDNDEPPPPPPFVAKFHVVDGTVLDSFAYDAGGRAGTTFDLAAANLNPRGVTSLDGSLLWVVDRSANVYVHDANGTLLGSWKANGVLRASGIATDGVSIWIVDDRNRRMVKYQGAANNPSTPAVDPVVSGTLNSTSFFALNVSNGIPTDATTNGTSIWVTDDGTTKDQVFEYSLTGVTQRVWSLAAGNSKPTGITVDPSGASTSLWVVDNGTRKVYEYAVADSLGNRQMVGTFDLSATNTNPQGIADPPPSVVSASSTASLANGSLATSASLGLIGNSGTAAALSVVSQGSSPPPPPTAEFVVVPVPSSSAAERSSKLTAAALGTLPVTSNTRRSLPTNTVRSAVYSPANPDEADDRVGKDLLWAEVASQGDGWWELQ